MLHIALHYIGIQYIDIHYSGIRYIAAHYIGIQYIATHNITLHYVTLRYTKLHCITQKNLTIPYISLTNTIGNVVATNYVASGLRLAVVAHDSVEPYKTKDLYWFRWVGRRRVTPKNYRQGVVSEPQKHYKSLFF